MTDLETFLHTLGASLEGNVGNRLTEELANGIFSKLRAMLPVKEKENADVVVS